jgi:carbonic anhydrase/acetyltransferase-like protein (isoleucine patch superfamily)
MPASTPILPQIHEGVFIAPNASVMGHVTLEAQASVWYAAVIRADVERVVVGPRSNIQDGAIIHADPGAPTLIGADVTVGHGAIVHGAIIGNGTLVGMRATVLNRARVGKNCLIGAHALVTEGMEIPDNSLVLGAPAKVVKTLSEAQIQLLQMGSAHYVHNAAVHAQGQFPLAATTIH